MGWGTYLFGNSPILRFLGLLRLAIQRLTLAPFQAATLVPFYSALDKQHVEKAESQNRLTTAGAKSSAGCGLPSCLLTSLNERNPWPKRACQACIWVDGKGLW